MTASKSGEKLSTKSEQMIRVDHAGEHGAVSIYRGQFAVFGNTDQKAEIAELVKHMAEQEQSHMDSFDKLILEKISVRLYLHHYGMRLDLLLVLSQR